MPPNNAPASTPAIPPAIAAFFQGVTLPSTLTFCAITVRSSRVTAVFTTASNITGNAAAPAPVARPVPKPARIFFQVSSLTL